MATVLRLYNINGNSSQIGWGKYAGKDVKWILEHDPAYLRWVYFNLKAAHMKGDICEALGLDPTIQFERRKQYYKQ